MRSLLFALLPLALVSVTYADRFYVSDDAAPGGDGSSWGNAYQCLQNALDQTVADRDDEVWIEAGTYYPDDGATVAESDRTANFTLFDEVSLCGGSVQLFAKVLC